MSENAVALHAVDPDAVPLRSTLPAPTDREPEELIRFRDAPHDDAAFDALRARFEADEDWHHLSLLYWVRGDAEDDSDIAGDCLHAAADLALAKLRDKDMAVQILSRHLQLAPNFEALQRLQSLLVAQRDLQTIEELLAWSEQSPHLELSAPQRAQLLADRGKLSLDRGDIHIGRQLLQRALSADPGCIPANNRYAHLLISVGAFAEAEAVLSQALSASTSRSCPVEQQADWLLLLAHVQQHGRDDAAAAASSLKAALERVPGDLELMLALSELSARSLYDESESARGSIDPSAPTLWAKTARVAREQHYIELARELLERALHYAPRSQAIRGAYRDLLEASDCTGELIRELEYGLDQFPEHSEERSALHLRCAGLRNQQLVQMIPAIEHWNAAISCTPRSQVVDQAWEALLRSYRAEGDWEQIANLLTRRLEAGRSPDPYQDRVELARIFREHLDEPTKAVRVDHRILSEHDLFDPIISASYKEYFRRRHEWRELQEALLFRIQEAEHRGKDQLPLSDPTFAEEFAELADVSERRLGDIAGAMDAWRRLLIAYPEDPRAKEQLERLQKRAQVWDSMLQTHDEELANCSDDQARASLLKRFAQIHRDRFRDPSVAIDLVHEYLQIEPDDLAMHRMLLALHERHGDAEKIAGVLEKLLDMGTNPAERLTILKRLCNLYQKPLQQPERAIECCEAQLDIAPKSPEPLRRMEQIYRINGQSLEEIDVINRQLDLTLHNEQRAVLLRRLARAQARYNETPEVQAETWEQLQQIEPDNQLILERLLVLAQQSNRPEQIERILETMIDRLKNFPTAQIERMVELAQWYGGEGRDIDRAEESWSRVLAIMPTHKLAFEKLLEIKKERDDVDGLLELLAAQAQIKTTQHHREQLLWQRVDLRANRRGEYRKAVALLEELREERPTQALKIHCARLEYLQQIDDLEEVIRECELGLIATDDPDERKGLHNRIREAYLDQDHIEGAIAVQRRYCHERPDDTHSLATLAELSLRNDELDGALSAYEQRRDLMPELAEKREADLHMAQLCEEREQIDRAWDYTLGPIRRNIEDEATWEPLKEFSQRHRRHEAYLEQLQLRLQHREEQGQFDLARELYLEASQIAEEQDKFPAKAFDWARKGYLRERSDTPLRTELCQRLWGLAHSQGLYAPLLDVLEDELNYSYQKEQVSVQSLTASVLEAAQLAETTLDDPERAITILNTSIAYLPLEGEVAEQLDAVCRRAHSWPALETLYQRRIQATPSGSERLEHYLSFIELCERQLEDPERAFIISLDAWEELRLEAPEAPELAEQALERAIGIGREHELWPQMAQLYQRLSSLAFAEGDRERGLDHTLEVVRIQRDLLDRPLEALRTLVRDLEHDTQGELLLEPIRSLSNYIDHESPLQGTRLGILIHLDALAKLLGQSRDVDLQVEWLSERAQLREECFQDPFGPVVEWMRVLDLVPDHGPATEKLAQLCEDPRRARLALFRPAWDLQHAKSPAQKSELLLEIADLYENRLERNEYAFRARLAAFRLQPWLPDPDSLDEEQQKLWSLASSIGAYAGPGLPEDELLRPRLLPPEREDRQRWMEMGLDHDHFYEIDHQVDLSGVHEKTRVVSLDSVLQSPVPTEISEDDDTDLQAIADEVQNDPGNEDDDGIEVIELEDLDMVEEDAELDQLVQAPNQVEPSLFDPEPDDSFQASDSLASAKLDPDAPLAPPPVDQSLIYGRPVVPVLNGPILPRRPRVDSAWQELSNVYGKLSSGDPQRDADVLLLQARMWEQSAEHVEAAFQAHEQALLRDPAYPKALQSLEGLSQRHDAPPRLIRSYRFLHQRAKSDDVAIAMATRLAELCEAQGDLDDAVQCHRDIIERDAQHLQSLSQLCGLYERKQEYGNYTETFAQKLEVERFLISEDERIDRSLHLAKLYKEKLGRTSESISTLRSLVDDHPQADVAHDRLIEALTSGQQWSQAVEAIRNAAEQSHEDERRKGLLSQAATIYSDQLFLPDRAIDIWQTLRDLSPDDSEAVGKLEQLYLETQRFEQLVQLLEQPPAEDAPPSHHQRRLVTKGLAWATGLADPERARQAFDELDQWLPLAVEHLDGIIRLAELTQARPEAIAMMQRSLDDLPAAHQAEVFEAWHRLSDPGSDTRDQLIQELDRALAATPDEASFIDLRAQFARERGEQGLLTDILGKSPYAEDRIEAARRRLEAKAPLDEVQELLNAAQELPPRHDPKALSAQMAELRFLLAHRQDQPLDAAFDSLQRDLLSIDNDELVADTLVAAAQEMGSEDEHQRELARQAYELAQSRMPSHVASRLNLAQLRVQAGESEQAQEMLQDIVMRTPQADEHDLFVQASIALAKIKAESGEPAEAYPILQQSARLLPHDVGLRLALAQNRFEHQAWRDLLSLSDQLDTQLQKKGEVDPKDHGNIAGVYALAAQAEKALRRPKAALQRFELSRKYDAQNPKVLAEIIDLAGELSMLDERVLAREQLAELHGEEHQQAGHQLLLGAIELFDATHPDPTAAQNSSKTSSKTSSSSGERKSLRKSAAGKSDEPGLARVEERQKRAQDLLRRAFGRLQKIEDDEVLPYSDLERIYPRLRLVAPALRLAAIDVWVRNPALDKDRRVALHLEAADAILRERQASHEELQLALRHAQTALELQPASARARQRLLQAFERDGQEQAAAQARQSALEAAPAEIFEATPEDLPEGIRAEREAWIELLYIFASHLDAGDPQCLDALGRVDRIAPERLSVPQRQKLIAAQLQALERGDDHPDASEERLLNSRRALLSLDPLAEGDHLEQVVATLRQRENPVASWSAQVLAAIRHDEASLALLEKDIPAPPQALDLQELWTPPPHSDSMRHALTSLWTHARDIVFANLQDPRTLTTDDPIKLGGGSQEAIAQSYHEAKLHIPDLEEFPAFCCLDIPPEQGILFVAGASPWFAVHPELLQVKDRARLLFVWTRAMCHAQPAAALSTGIDASLHSPLLSAVLLAFHPRHTRRRHQARQEHDLASKLGLALARKVPIRCARSISREFKDHPYAAFDSRPWNAYLHDRAERSALLVSGRIASIRHRGIEDFAQSLRRNERVRQLCAFMLSDDFDRLRSQSSKASSDANELSS